MRPCTGLWDVALQDIAYFVLLTYGCKWLVLLCLFLLLVLAVFCFGFHDMIGHFSRMHAT